jgi:hypothetical protein
MDLEGEIVSISMNGDSFDVTIESDYKDNLTKVANEMNLTRLPSTTVSDSLECLTKSASDKENKTLPEKGATVANIVEDARENSSPKKSQKSEKDQGSKKTRKILKFTKVFKKVSPDGHLVSVSTLGFSLNWSTK